MKPTTEDILSAIENSGYLFEQRVSHIIKDTKICGNVTTNSNYTDEESGKSREIDIFTGYRQTFASHLGPGTQTKLFDQLQVHFLFECKNNHQPVVLFCRDNHRSNNFPILTGIPESYVKNHNSIPFIWHIENAGLRFKEPNQWIATQYGQIQEPKGKTKKDDEKIWSISHDGYYESITGLIKAANYYTLRHHETIQEGHITNKKIQLCLIYPIIVLGGEIRECRVHQDKYDLTKVENALLKREFFSQHIQGEFNIHVTTENYLPKLLQKLDKQIKSMESIIQDYIIEKRKK